MMYNDALWWMELMLILNRTSRVSSNLKWPGLGGIYRPHTPKELLGKADKNSYRRLNRRSSFVNTGSTGECTFHSSSRYCLPTATWSINRRSWNHRRFNQWVQAQKPPKNGVSGQLYRRFRNQRRFNRCTLLIWPSLSLLHRWVQFSYRQFNRW